MKHLPLFRLILGLWLCSLSGKVMAQTPQSTEEKLDSITWKTYDAQARQLVSFVEFMFNTLGDPLTPVQEKQRIINQSYLKVFRDSEVQLEDDLIPDRSTVVHKAVSAYLKDIDFFFEQVAFTYTIVDVQYSYRENGLPFLLFETQRMLAGKDYQGQSLQNQQIRYVEININPAVDDMKIVSMYANPFPQQPQLEAWWKGLSMDWKRRFAPFMWIDDTISFSTLMEQGIDPIPGTTILIDRSTYAVVSDSFTQNYVSLLGQDAKLGDTIRLEKYDTLLVTQGLFTRAASQLLNRESLDFSGQTRLKDLTPLSLFARLKTLNLSQTAVSSLFPLRQLTMLEHLDCSYSQVSELSFLSYLTNLKTLVVDGCPISSLNGIEQLHLLQELSAIDASLIDVSALKSLTQLQVLNLAQTQVSELRGIANLGNLQILNLSSTPVRNIKLVGELHTLEELDLSFSAVSNLSPIANCTNLQKLYITGIAISEVDFLNQLPNLKLVQADQTLVPIHAWDQFQQTRSEVVILHRTASLMSWWVDLPDNWKKCLVLQFPQILSSLHPSADQLHRLVRVDSLSLRQSGITHFAPITEFRNLQALQASGLSVPHFQDLAGLKELSALYLKDCEVGSLSGLEGLRELKKLDLSGTIVGDLSQLSRCKKLQLLKLNQTSVSQLLPLYSLPRLQRLELEQTSVTQGEVRNCLAVNPQLLIIFRTEKLIRWWKLLDPNWKAILQSQYPTTNVTPEWLHRLTSVEAISLERGQELKDLYPLQVFLRLTHIDAKNAGIQELFGIETHQSLEVLDISQNPVFDLSPLASLSRLQELYLANTAVKEIDAVAELGQLQHLDCAGTQVDDLKALAQLGELNTINCANTQVSNLRPIANCKSLQKLVCYNTKLNRRKVDQHKASLPNCEVIFY